MQKKFLTSGKSVSSESISNTNDKNIDSEYMPCRKNKNLKIIHETKLSSNILLDLIDQKSPE